MRSRRYRIPVHLSQILALAAAVLLGSAGHAATPASARATPSPAPRGPYLGQAAPAATAVIFAPGFASTDLCERDITFSPDGQEIYWTLQGGGSYADWYAAIVFARQEDGRWTAPRVAPFSGRYNDVEPSIAPDGRRLYFSSNRPLAGTGDPKKDYDIWYVERTPAGWGEPQNLGPPVNTDKDEFYPSLTRDGTLYLTAAYEGVQGREGIFRSRPVDGRFAQPENLGDSVNTRRGEYNALIAPDESFLVFGRSGELFVCFRRDDGSWTSARHLEGAFDSPNLDYCPALSPDGTYFFFTSTRPPGIEYARPVPPGFTALLAQIPDPHRQKMLRVRLMPYEDLYWVRSDFLETLRKEALR